MKKYRITYGIGKAKYVVSFCTGEKTHKDGSPFFDCKIFTNKRELNRFERKLKNEGFTI